MPKSYWQYPEHNTWQQHYTEGCYGGLYLAFTKEFREEFLPKSFMDSRDHTDVQIELVIKQHPEGPDRPVWKGLHALAFQPDDRLLSVQDLDWNGVWVQTLHDYFYGSHFCGCHREQMVTQAGFTGSPECEQPGDRVCSKYDFRIRRAYWKKYPNLTLISETMSLEELEAELQKLKEPGKCNCGCHKNPNVIHFYACCDRCGEQF